jgi:hypothetical protein
MLTYVERPKGKQRANNQEKHCELKNRFSFAQENHTGQQTKKTYGTVRNHLAISRPL